MGEKEKTLDLTPYITVLPVRTERGGGTVGKVVVGLAAAAAAAVSSPTFTFNSPLLFLLHTSSSSNSNSYFSLCPSLALSHSISIQCTVHSPALVRIAHLNL